MKRSLLLLALVLTCPSVSHAHFLWLLTGSQSGSAKVQVFFSEAAEPDDPDLLDKVIKAEVWAVEGRGEPKLLTLKKSGDALEADLGQPVTTILRHTYGVSAKGGEPFLLKYYAKTHPFALPGTWRAIKDNERLPLEIVPAIDAAGTRLTVTWKGQPQAGATVTIVGPGIGKKLEGLTDAAGVFRCDLTQAGIYSIRARHTEATAGKLDDKEYKSVRHYSTLTLHHARVRLAPVAHDLPALPKGTTSFGGAVVGDMLYVYGGNYGSAHEYVHEDQSGDLWKLDLKKPGAWEQATGGAKLQGLAMVEHRGLLYRVGGFTATNRSGEKEDLRSQADFARFDPAGSVWESLPSLPEPRSSHDAAVVGDTLYVVGGWNMQGGGKGAKWHDAALSLNLAADKPEWRPIASAPFKRRALAVAAWKGRLYCLGGMQEQGGPTTAVAVYDPAKNAWSEGAAMLGNAMDGFGSSAFACGNSLYVTTSSGSIQRLSGDGEAWEFVGQLAHPRFFHRLLPWQDGKLVIVGGSNMSTGKTVALELLSPNDTKTGAR